MITHIYSYLLTGLLMAALFDVFIICSDENIKEKLPGKYDRLLVILCIIFLWLPLIILSIYDFITGKAKL